MSTPSAAPIAAAPSPSSPPGRLPVASTHWLWGCLREFQTDSLAALDRITRDHGDAMKVRFAYLHYYFFNHPDAVKHILQERPANYVKSPNAQKLKVFLGEGLLLSEGDFWRRQRRIAQPGFHRQRLVGIAQRFVAAADTTVEELRAAAAGGAPVDIAAHSMRMTLDAVASALSSRSRSERPTPPASPPR